ncbi:non-ribosomal peptide synthetase [Actinoalloteichus caeruleus]|uniref:Amino acid adenylation domain-containing protein n=1 Tax=Actinoalloteichus caeruleus DSM 43889 TaxID=1120930 RepID=A0ABT1JFP1_ACTCY|nr:non-ribosomal peptide synthetase [Actinoalloteichus caeruleus]MCP2330596.1 amino acid adenylation domain-containing protein [Actinoalloteichus caeruleus DSM 43889]
MTGWDGDVYTRPVAPMDTWFLLYPDAVAGIIQVFVEGTGTIDPDRLAEAVEAASEACPGTRLVREGRTWVDSGVAPPLRVVDGSRLDRTAFTGMPVLHDRMPETGPPCEVLLLTGSPTTVVFRADHAALDGKGVLVWVEDVFRVLRGERPRGASSELTEADVIAGAPPPSGTALVSDLEWPSALGAAPPHRTGLFWRRRTVDGAHPALVAKIASALTRYVGRPVGRFMVPVDLRRHAPDIRSTGNLITNLLYEASAEDDWHTAHERLLTLLAGNVDLLSGVDPSLSRVPLETARPRIAALDGFSARSNRYPALAMLSHLGRIDLAELSTDTFHATTLYPLPSSGPIGPPELNFVECGGRTEITIGWHDSPGTARRAEELLDVLADVLSPGRNRTWAGNDTDRPLAREGTVVEQFRAQVARTPDSVVLTGPEGEISYAELDRRSDAVAAELVDRGLGPDALVGLLAGRTVAAMAGIWGILKAGAAYLPLDPGQPDARLADLVTDAGVTTCLAEREHAGRTAIPGECAAVVLEDVAASGRRVPAAPVAPDDLAYVIYTSGSTGRPKGVEIQHRALSTFVSWATRIYEVGPDTRFPLFSSLAFDLSNTAIFLPVLAGGSVALVPDELDHLVLRDVLENLGATALKLTPTHLDLIGRLGLRPTGFRTVIAGGELLRGPVARRAQETFGEGCRIFNEYGPTETTVGCMTWTFDPDRDGGAVSVPIGVPTDNTRIHLLDADRRFVEPGEVGEMYLSGAQLARGYRGRPDLDRERFVTLADGTRAYRSGDLARMLPSGVLESAGRDDEQLKINGYRIEPAEVARALEEHPSVTRAFAVGRARGEDRTLCAYVVPGGGGEVDVDALTEHVRALLPRYMVPSVISVVREIPRTGNGKVDVSRLPDPFTGAAGEPSDGERRDEVEEAVATIWSTTLAVPADRIAGDADFHRLGGDSAALLAMLATVSREVVGKDQEQEFMSHLPTIVRRPTLSWVSELVRRSRHTPV